MRARDVIPTARATTDAVSISAAPVVVFAVIADPLRLPEWSPTFARTVVPHASQR